MELTKDAAEKIISDMGMDDMPLIAVRPVPTKVPANWFPRYKELCREFMQSLTDSVETLAFMNLSQDEFMNLLMGRSVPQNMSFRFRTPLTWGGKLETDNLFMCWTFPHSQLLDEFIISQSGNDKIWLPNPTKKVYQPISTSIGGAGGNATEDRLTEFSAAMTSGRDI
ncbi:MAG: hypothetical protein J6K82_04135 [Alphaproteobacteria bacterium]|nr:hypothetical protein [Alphaproteobacteria bacterium]